MAALSDAVKLFIVQRLAVFDTPTQVIAAVKETFELDVSKQQVYFYDPTVGVKPSKKLCAEFKRTRRRFLKRTSDIPIANKAVRLQRLNRLQLLLEDKKNYPLAAQLLEQAAKEMGDAFTNRRELTGKDGQALMPRAPLDDLTNEQLLERAKLLAATAQ